MNAPTVIDKQHSYIQFIYDNVDHNVATLDGHNTFRAMGRVKCVTPANAVHEEAPILRTEKVSTEMLEPHGLTKVTVYPLPRVFGYSFLTAENLETVIQEPESARTGKQVDFLWIWNSWLQKSPVPGWNEFMDTVYNNISSYNTSEILPLPFVNLDPSNPSTIYTCLLHAAEEGEKVGQSKTVVTFDQPLYAKACEMVLAAEPNSPLSHLIIRLGGFHLLKSFLGAIGNIMAGSGFEQLWETIYEKNTIPHMMSGHAYARCLRAHFLTQQALGILLLESFSIDGSLMDELKTVYGSLFDNTNFLDDGLHSSSLDDLIFERKLENIESHSWTGKLWVQYFKLVDIAEQFIRAERCGDWDLHLHSVKLMIPYLHATGHLHYAKSAQEYFQQMVKLESDMNPEEFNKFKAKGYFTIRRSDKFWSGVWTGTTIEQVLMRSIKTSGGLTRGRGITPSVLAKWVGSIPATSRMIRAVEYFSGVITVTSEQHSDFHESRQKRDHADLTTFKNWLFNCSTPSLTSIVSGIVANE